VLGVRARGDQPCDAEARGRDLGGCTSAYLWSRSLKQTGGPYGPPVRTSCIMHMPQ